MKLLAVCLLFALVACATGEPLPPIEGAWVNLNPTMWHPNEAERAAIKELPER